MRYRFCRVIYSQGIVLIFAYLEAFLSDSLRVIFTSTPDILKSDKTLTFEEIMAHASMEGLIDCIIDKLIYDSGWGSINKKVDFLTKKVKLELHIENKTLDLLKILELERNVLVHNNGKIDLEFQKKVPSEFKDRYKTGDLVIVTSNIFKINASIACELASKVFQAVATKYLDRPFKDVCPLNIINK